MTNFASSANPPNIAVLSVGSAFLNLVIHASHWDEIYQYLGLHIAGKETYFQDISLHSSEIIFSRLSRLYRIWNGRVVNQCFPFQGPIKCRERGPVNHSGDDSDDVVS